MPRDKKRKDSSDSDSGSGSGSDSDVEEKKPPAKKQKQAPTKAKASNSSSSKTRNEDNEVSWNLDARKMLKIREFKGKLYIDIREYYNGPNGDLLPSKKGISLTPECYQKFKSLISEIDDELKKF